MFRRDENLLISFLPTALPTGFSLLESASMICVPRRALALMRFGHPRLRIQQFACGAIWELFSSQQSALSILTLISADLLGSG